MVPAAFSSSAETYDLRHGLTFSHYKPTDFSGKKRLIFVVPLNEGALKFKVEVEKNSNVEHGTRPTRVSFVTCTCTVRKNFWKIWYSMHFYF